MTRSLQRDNQSAQFLYWGTPRSIAGGIGFELDESSGQPYRWTAAVFLPRASDRLSPGQLEFGSIHLEPIPEAAATETARNVAIHFFLYEGSSCDAFGTEPIRWMLRTPERGELVQPGVGALVRTAGFWENGTLFYTNLDRIHNDTRIPRAGWYEFSGSDPLKVYVYNQSRGELPPRYNQSSNRFATTIPGFNQALKTMETTGSRVAHLAPDEAYTRPGNERHPLYGDPLVFHIEVLDVVAINCPVPTGPVCEAPSPPPTANPLS